MRRIFLLSATFIVLQFCSGAIYADEKIVVPLPIPGAPIQSFAIDHTAPHRIVVSTIDHGVFFSADGGDTWDFQFSIHQNAAEQITFDAENPNRVFMANMSRPTVGDLESHKFSRIPTDGLPNDGTSGIACGRKIKGSLYSLCRDQVLKPYLFTPEDSAWHPMMQGIENDSTRIVTIHENPVDSNVYLVTTAGLYSTEENPKSWTFKTPSIYRSYTLLEVYNVAVNQATNQIVGLTDDSLVFYSPRFDTLYAFPRPDNRVVQALAAVHDESNTVFAVVGFRLYMISEGTLWEEIPISGARSIATDPSDPDIVYVGTRKRGMQKSVDGGRTWKAANDRLNYWADMSDMVVDHSDNAILYVALQDYIMKSEDRGMSWTLAATFNNAPYHLTMSPANPRVIYGGRVGHPFRTFDGFETMDQLLDDNLRTSKKIHIHPKNPKLLFAIPRDRSGLATSPDSGETWSITPAPNAESSVYGMVLDPEDPAHIFVQCKRPSEGSAALELFETLDTGQTWTSICDSFSYDRILVDPHTDNLIAYGHNHDPSVVYSEDGREWTSLDTSVLKKIIHFAVSPHTPDIRAGASTAGSIPITLNDGQLYYDLSPHFPEGAQVLRMRFDPVDENCLYVITRKDGLFRVRLDLVPDDETGSGKPVADHRPDLGDVSIRIRHGKLRLEGLPFTPERIRLYSVGGRRMLDQRIGPGKPRRTVPVGDVPTGMYVLNVTGRNESTACRFMKKISIMRPTE